MIKISLKQFNMRTPTALAHNIHMSQNNVPSVLCRDTCGRQAVSPSQFWWSMCKWAHNMNIEFINITKTIHMSSTGYFTYLSQVTCLTTRSRLNLLLTELHRRRKCAAVKPLALRPNSLINISVKLSVFCSAAKFPECQFVRQCPGAPDGKC